MANEEHLEILEQGIEVWNQWREEDPDAIPDLSQADLYRAVLCNANFNNTNLSEVNICAARLRNADLRNANLREANLCTADLRNADLRNANLRNADLQAACLHKANLSSADLTESYLIEANLSEAYLYRANLSSADLTESILNGANLSEANFSQANFSRAYLGFNNFRNTNFNEANLSGANLSNTNLSGAKLKAAQLLHTNFCYADLSSVDLSGADLSGAKLKSAILSHADLRSAHLYGAELNNANLQSANLTAANLSCADLSCANLKHANLNTSQILEANFTKAILTGACIANWQIGSSTELDGVVCDYIYRTIDENGHFSGRLPIDPNSTFAPGEFTQRFQILESALETIDLTFTEGIDWQAFFRSFQELRSQHPGSDLSIQGMERKAEGFVIRLEVNQEADKATIETQAKQLYAAELKALEAQYEKQLRLQGEHHTEEVRRMIEAERQEKATLMGIIATMANNQGPKYDLRGSQFAGGLAETVEGDQIGRNQSQQSS